MTARRAVALAVLIALASCNSPRIHRAVGAPVLPPTRSEDVRVIGDLPSDALVLGEIEATGHVIFGDAISTAISGAASLGADAIVIEGAGPGTTGGGDLLETRDVVRAKALRLAR